MAHNLKANAQGNVVQDYKGGHSYSSYDPRFPLAQCKISRAQLDGSQNDLIIFSDPVLSIGTRINGYYLESINHPSMDNLYYLADPVAMINSFHKAANATPAPAPQSAPSPSKSDQFKSRAEILNITRGMF